MPAIVFVIYLLIRYRKDLPHPGLAILSVAIVCAHLVIVSAFPHWWAGHCYGPRFTTDLVPWFALLGILAVKARELSGKEDELGRHSLVWKTETAAGAILLLMSVGINARGAMNTSTSRWNYVPVNVDEYPERVWDWKHPQFLASRRDQDLESK